jgi:hypothetical protein
MEGFQIGNFRRSCTSMLQAFNGCRVKVTGQEISTQIECWVGATVLGHGSSQELEIER